MTKTLTIHIDTDGKTTFRMEHTSIDVYEEIVNTLKKKRDIELSNTYILYNHITKVWYEEVDDDKDTN